MLEKLLTPLLEIQPTETTPAEEEDYQPTLYEKKVLKMWKAREKGWKNLAAEKPTKPLPKPKRGWMSGKYRNLKIEDVINFICIEKKNYQPMTRDIWMHNYTYKLYPKGIVYLWHLNQIPYGKPWRNLALSKGITISL